MLQLLSEFTTLAEKNLLLKKKKQIIDLLSNTYLDHPKRALRRQAVIAVNKWHFI